MPIYYKQFQAENTIENLLRILSRQSPVNAYGQTEEAYYLSLANDRNFLKSAFSHLMNAENRST